MTKNSSYLISSRKSFLKVVQPFVQLLIFIYDLDDNILVFLGFCYLLLLILTLIFHVGGVRKNIHLLGGGCFFIFEAYQAREKSFFASKIIGNKENNTDKEGTKS